MNVFTRFFNVGKVKKPQLTLPRKRMLATFAAILCMMIMMPLTAKAQQTVINIEGQQITIRQYSTLYVGEVLLDGQQSFYYLYSEDIKQSTTVFGAVKDCLSNFKNGQYRALVPSLVGATDDVGMATCSNPAFEPMMNSDWISAGNAGLACLPNATVVSSSSDNLYATNPDFVATCAAFVATEYGEATIVDGGGQDVAIDGILGKLSASNSDVIAGYQVVNGHLVTVINRTIYYDCESITVIYTRAELRSLMTETPLTFEAIENGTITVNLDDGATLEAIQYKLNDAEWTNVTWNTPISLVANDVIKFRGDNGTCYIYDDDLEIWAGFHFECSNRCYVYGNMMSLIDKDDFVTNTTLTEPYTFFHLFQTSNYEPNTTILNHPNKDIVLPATTLTANCYDGLFDGCQGMTRAPELPATTLADWCYCMMFAGTGITTAPALPATTLAEACYSDMFMNCTRLTAAPDLPAATLAVGCYSSMFTGCTSLNYVKCLATDISAVYCTVNWLWGVAATGTFVKAADMNDWPIGPDAYDNVDGIPAGWTVKEDMYSLPLTIEIIEADTKLSLSNPAYGVPFEYSYDGVTWIECAANTTTETTISDAGNKVYFRGNNTKGVHIGTDKPCYVYGNVMSMVTTNDFASCTTITQEYAFYNMFYNEKIMNHPTRELVLPAKTLTANCYSGMFGNCTNLTTAPELPATTLKDNCYSGMLKGCTGLTTAPVLPATKLAEGCYYSMFYGCTALTTAPELPSTALENNCYYWMFYGCTNLESAPKLPATTLKECCYAGMFINCTNLTAAPELPATSLVNSCYWAMFNGCSSLNYVKCLATDLGTGNTDYWLADVAANGTFVKVAGMTGWTTGQDGIPTGWTVENIDVFTTNGNWDVAANWSGNTVPADGSDVAIMANATIPSCITVNVDDIDLYGTLTIADGGQLYHNNEGVTATIQESITAYDPSADPSDGWHLIGYSFAENGVVAEMDNLTANEYDLYYYDEPTHYWKNQKNTANSLSEMEAGRGYLYANNQTVTLGLTGILKTGNALVNVPLDYTEAAGNLKGFNLVGNPFAHNVTTYTGTNVAAECYRMNEAKTNLIVSNLSAADPLKPAESFFVKATASNASITFNSGAKGQVATPAGIQLDLVQNGLTLDRIIIKREGQPLEKLTLNENITRIFAAKDSQEMAVTIVEGNEQAINFKAAKNGEYTLTVNPEDVTMDYLHLIDNLTGAEVDLLQTPSYSFEGRTSDYTSRFKLVFQANDAEDEDFAFISNGQLIVNGKGMIQIVDLLGHVLLTRNTDERVGTEGLGAGVYVIRLINGENVRTQKIVVK